MSEMSAIRHNFFSQSMAHYKPLDHHSLVLPVILSEQMVPGTFALALNYLTDHELGLNPLDARFKNDELAPVLVF